METTVLTRIIIRENKECEHGKTPKGHAQVNFLLLLISKGSSGEEGCVSCRAFVLLSAVCTF